MDQRWRKQSDRRWWPRTVNQCNKKKTKTKKWIQKTKNNEEGDLWFKNSLVDQRTVKQKIKSKMIKCEHCEKKPTARNDGWAKQQIETDKANRHRKQDLFVAGQLSNTNHKKTCIDVEQHEEKRGRRAAYKSIWYDNINSVNRVCHCVDDEGRALGRKSKDEQRLNEMWIINVINK